VIVSQKSWASRRLEARPPNQVLDVPLEQDGQL